MTDVFGISPKTIKIDKNLLKIKMIKIAMKNYKIVLENDKNSLKNSYLHFLIIQLIKVSFPNNLKIALTHPIHKGKSKLTASNYRPISIFAHPK